MRVVVELPSSPQAPARARAALSGTRTVLDEDLHADLVLVVSELVTNSVKYGPGRPIRIDVETDGPRKVRGEVVDQGEGAELVAAAAPDDDEPGGRGLRIVDQLARWGVREGSTHVWFELGDG
jgi:anti-sigma regulatory factor (Ser/Thr protein kinase)